MPRAPTTSLWGIAFMHARTLEVIASTRHFVAEAWRPAPLQMREARRLVRAALYRALADDRGPVEPEAVVVALARLMTDSVHPGRCPA